MGMNIHIGNIYFTSGPRCRHLRVGIPTGFAASENNESIFSCPDGYRGRGRYASGNVLPYFGILLMGMYTHFYDAQRAGLATVLEFYKRPARTEAQ